MPFVVYSDEDEAEVDKGETKADDDDDEMDEADHDDNEAAVRAHSQC